MLTTVGLGSQASRTEIFEACWYRTLQTLHYFWNPNNSVKALNTGAAVIMPKQYSTFLQNVLLNMYATVQ